MQPNTHTQIDTISGPHNGQPVLLGGDTPAQAKAAMICLHGRGAGAYDILSVANEVDGAGWAFLAPQAAHATWYPRSFLAPLGANEPHLSSALELVDALVEQVAADGVPRERIVLMGFSQGACLATEYAARNATRFGGVVAFSGGLIGDAVTLDRYAGGDFEGTPVFFGCSDIDPHIPVERVEASVNITTELGAEVTKKLYPGMGHTVNMDELEHLREMMKGVTS